METIKHWWDKWNYFRNRVDWGAVAIFTFIGCFGLSILTFIIALLLKAPLTTLCFLFIIFSFVAFGAYLSYKRIL